MKCQEFRQFNATDKSCRVMTRAERASCHAHYLGCQKCRKFISRTVPDGEPESMEKLIEESRRLHAEIESDPEIR